MAVVCNWPHGAFVVYGVAFFFGTRACLVGVAVCGFSLGCVLFPVKFLSLLKVRARFCAGVVPSVPRCLYHYIASNIDRMG